MAYEAPTIRRLGDLRALTLNTVSKTTTQVTDCYGLPTFLGTVISTDNPTPGCPT